MCRMLGVAAATSVSVRELLSEAPRSLRTLSLEHADGWGVAVHDGSAWTVDRGTACAAACERFAQTAHRETRLLVAHVRKKTVGPTAIVNTHPFQRDGFVFAHNGTLTDHALAAVLAMTPAAQLARVEGDTDSERLFAFVLHQIEVAGDITRGVAHAVATLHALGDLGSASFLLSCGARLYAHRAARALFTLQRPYGVVVASEPLTDDAWVEVPERGLLAIDPTSTSAIAA